MKVVIVILAVFLMAPAAAIAEQSSGEADKDSLHATVQALNSQQYAKHIEAHETLLKGLPGSAKALIDEMKKAPESQWADRIAIAEILVCGGCKEVIPELIEMLKSQGTSPGALVVTDKDGRDAIFFGGVFAAKWELLRSTTMHGPCVAYDTAQQAYGRLFMAEADIADFLLRQMTGQDFKFDAYADEKTKSESIEKWKEWWKKEGEGFKPAEVRSVPWAKVLAEFAARKTAPPDNPAFYRVNISTGNGLPGAAAASVRVVLGCRVLFEKPIESTDTVFTAGMNLIIRKSGGFFAYSLKDGSAKGSLLQKDVEGFLNVVCDGSSVYISTKSWVLRCDENLNRKWRILMNNNLGLIVPGEKSMQVINSADVTTLATEDGKKIAVVSATVVEEKDIAEFLKKLSEAADKKDAMEAANLLATTVLPNGMLAIAPVLGGKDEKLRGNAVAIVGKIINSADPAPGRLIAARLCEDGHLDVARIFLEASDKEMRFFTADNMTQFRMWADLARLAADKERGPAARAVLTRLADLPRPLGEEWSALGDEYATRALGNWWKVASEDFRLYAARTAETPPEGAPGAPALSGKELAAALSKWNISDQLNARIPELVNVLENGSRKEREALGARVALLKDQEALNAAITWLDKPAMQSIAVGIISAFGAQGVNRVLGSSLSNEIKVAALRGICMGNNEDAVMRVIEYCSDMKSDSNIAWPVKSLWDRDGDRKRFVPYFIALLSDGGFKAQAFSVTRWLAETTFNDFGYEMVPGNKPVEELVKKYEKWWEENKDKPVAMWMVSALVNPENSWIVKRNAIRGLTRNPVDRSVDEALEGAMKNITDSNRWALADVLYQHGNTKYGAEFAKFLAEGKDAEIESVIHYMENLKNDKDVQKAACEILKDKQRQRNLRSSILYFIGFSNTQIDGVFEAIALDIAEDISLRQSAIGVLAHYTSDKSREALVTIFQSEVNLKEAVGKALVDRVRNPSRVDTKTLYFLLDNIDGLDKDSQREVVIVFYRQILKQNVDWTKVMQNLEEHVKKVKEEWAKVKASGGT